MKNFNYEVTDIIKTLSTKETDRKTTTLELNKVSWNGSSEKYDLRIWSTDKETSERTPYKGITLDKDQLKALYIALQGLFKE